MKSAPKTTVRIEVEHPKQGGFGSVLAELSRSGGMTLNLLRGRVTKNKAWFKVEIDGGRLQVSNLVRLASRSGARVRSLGEEASCAH